MHSETMYVIVAVGLFIFLAHGFNEIFKRTRFPDVLLLIALGIFIGPLLGLIGQHDFTRLGPILTTVTLVVILFEEGSRIEIAQVIKTMRQTLSLVFVGFVITMAVVALAVAICTPFYAPRALMLGAVLASISPAVVIPLLRGLKIQESTRLVLFLESAMLDVVSIVVSLGFLEAYIAGQFRPTTLVIQILLSFLAATFIGLISGVAWSLLLSRIRSLENDIVITPAFLFMVFGITEWLGYSGFIAALVFGVTLGNAGLINTTRLKRWLPVPSVTFNRLEKTVFSEMVFLLKTFFFIYLGITIKMQDTMAIAFGAALTALILLVRLPVVRFFISKTTPVYDASIMAVLAPKGLAVIALATFVVQSKIPGSLFVQDVAYSVVLFSILASSILIPLANKKPLTSFFHLYLKPFGQPGRDSQAEASTAE